jgi:cysteinyl-tRNA synthetase
MDYGFKKSIFAYFEDMDHLNIRRADEYPERPATIDGIKDNSRCTGRTGSIYHPKGDVYYSSTEIKIGLRQTFWPRKLLGTWKLGKSGQEVNQGRIEKRDSAALPWRKQRNQMNPPIGNPWGNGRGMAH